MKLFGLLLLVLVTLLRISLVGGEKPSPQEAYYYLCAERPALAFFDGPAGVATMVRLVKGVSHGDLAWRLSSPILAALATLGCYWLGRRIADERGGLLSALLVNLAPVFNVWALRVTPDLPALTLVVFGFLAGWIAVHREKGVLGFWVFAAVFFGGAVLFSYWSLLGLLGLALVVLAKRKHRTSDLAGLGFLIALPAAALAPALVWNAGQNWIPIAGGTFRTIWNFTAMGFLEQFGRVLLMLSPVTILLGLAGFGDAARHSRSRVGPRFIFCATLPLVAAGFYGLLRGDNSSVLFLAAMPVVLPFLEKLPFPKAVGQWTVFLAIVCGVSFSIIAVSRTLPEGRGWEAAAAEVRKDFMNRLSEGQEDLFLVANDENVAAILGYYLKDDLIPPPGHPVVYVQESQDISNQFALWPSYDDFVETTEMKNQLYTEQKGENPFVGRNVLYITTEAPDDFPQAIKAAFQKVDPPVQFFLGEKGQEPLYIYHCDSYQTLPL